jgi:hypothetical protein
MSGRSKVYLLMAFGFAAVLIAAKPDSRPDFNGWVCHMAKGFGYCVQNQ